MLVVILALVLTTLLFYNTIVDWFKVRWQNHPSGPISLPIVGGVWALNPAHLPQQLAKMSNKFGNVISVRVGFQGHIVFLNSLSAIDSVLRNKSTANRPYHPILQYLSSGGYGLMVADRGKLWRAHSQMCHSALSLHLNPSLEGKIIKVLDILYSRLSVKTGEEYVINPHTELYRMASTFMFVLLFGDDAKCLSEERLNEEMEQSKTIVSVLAPTSLLHLFPILLKFPNRWQKEILRQLRAKDKMFMEELNKYLTNQKVRKNLSNAKMNERMEECGSVFQLFVKEMMRKSSTFHQNGEFTSQEDNGHSDYNDVYSFRHLQNTIWGLRLAGVETTASGLDWIVLLMAAFPEVKKKAKKEILKVLGSNSPRLEDKPNLHYIQAVLCECLRIGTFVGLCPPHVSETPIAVEGYTIPKGTPLIANFWAVHHDPELWPEPNTLKPERFLDKSGHFLPKKNFPGYMPFSHGWRPCTGTAVSQAFLFLFLVTILQRFDITLVGQPDLEGVMSFGMYPKPYQVIFTSSKSQTMNSL